MPFINDMLNSTTNKHGTQDKASAEPNSAGSVMPSRFVFDPNRVMTYLRKRIVAQETALACIESNLRVIKADLRDSGKPLFVMLMLGPTGVGKTETVRLLAESIQGSTDSLCRIDMNTLSQEHYSSALISAPPGYVGSKEGSTLLNAELIQGSFSRPGIVLFDEIEKASPAVVRTLLNVIETGSLKLTSANRSIDFRNSLIFMTSNLGAKACSDFLKKQQKGVKKFIKSSRSSQDKKIQKIMDDAIHEHFDPEFINRIDGICVYNALTENSVNALIEIELEKLNQRLQKKGANLALSEGAKAWLGSQYFELRFGAQSITRAFRLAVEPALAKAMALAVYPASSNIIHYHADVKRGELMVRESQRFIPTETY